MYKFFPENSTNVPPWARAYCARWHDDSIDRSLAPPDPSCNEDTSWNIDIDNILPIQKLFFDLTKQFLSFGFYNCVELIKKYVKQI